MDSLTTQKPKSRKIKRVTKKSRVQIILDLFFRAIEIIVVLVTISKLCYELVITFQDSGVAEVIIANRGLAFVLGNAIVIGLFAKSGVFLSQEVEPKCKRTDLYEEFVRHSSRREGEKETKQSVITETITKQNEVEDEKQNISEKIEKKTKQRVSMKKEKMTKQIIDITMKMSDEKKQTQSYQRSKSENLESVEKSSCGKLKRSETDTRIDSDDELRYKIESFIARQRRNQNDD